MEYNYKIVPFDFEYTKIDILEICDDSSFFVTNHNNQRIYKIFKDRTFCIDVTDNWCNILNIFSHSSNKYNNEYKS
jgi:hypothetical protein